MDLSPFELIDPCGYAGLQVTSIRNLGLAGSVSTIADALLEKLAAQLRRP
jgi:lipoyl(octanoyl) transferase